MVDSLANLQNLVAVMSKFAWYVCVTKFWGDGIQIPKIGERGWSFRNTSLPNALVP